MHDTVLVPLDGSSFAEQVLPLAATIARKSGMAVELVKLHRAHPAGYAQDATLAALDAAGRGRALSGEYLRTTADHLAKRASIRVCSRVLDDPSSTAEAICGEAARVNAAMIAMTTHGRTGLVRAVRGSVADEVLKHARMPVLLWRPAADGDGASAATPGHVLVTLDGSMRAESVLPAATALASVLEARVTLLRVVPHVSAPVPELVAATEAAAAAHAPFASGVESAVDREATQCAVARAHAGLERIRGRVRLEHPELDVVGIVVNEDVPWRAILRVAEDIGAELIAMSTRGRGASRLVVGSTVDHVLCRRRGATLLVRPTMPVPGN